MTAGAASEHRTGWLEVLAIVGLLVVWPVGVVLLWTSRVWSTGAKVIGTLVPPGGYLAPLVVVWTVVRTAVPVCPASSDLNGQLSSADCATQVSMTASDVALTIIAYGLGLFWLALPIASAVLLVIRAWPSAGVLRPPLVLTVTAVPPVVVVAIAAAFVSVGPPQALESPPVPQPGVQVVRTPGLSNLTQAHFAAALKERGLTCDPPAQRIGTWTTGCRAGSGTVVTAIGTSERTVDAVTAARFRQDEASGTADAGELFTAVVQAVSPPADAAQMSAWVRDHLASGGQTDIDGYHLTIVETGGLVSLTISESPS